MASLTKTSSKKAWYCRKGRGDKERIEKLIAARREREARIAQNNQKNHSYFSNWQRQTEWLTHSNEVCKNKPDKICKLAVPYDLDFIPTAKREHLISNKITSKLKAAKEELKLKLVAFQECSELGETLKKEGDKLCYQIESFLTLKKALQDKQENWAIKQRKVYYCRFAKDRLRSKIFIVCELLNFYKVTVECLSKLCLDDYIGKREKEELNSLVSYSLEIINSYIQLYQQKNNELIPIYNEQAENRWQQFESVYEEDRQVWSSIADNLMECFFLILKCKLEENLSQQEIYCDKKSKALEELIKLIRQFELDADLLCLPELDVNELAK